MNLVVNFEICDPNKSVLIGMRMKKGRVFEFINGIALPTNENELKISFGFLLFKIDFVFKYDTIE